MKALATEETSSERSVPQEEDQWAFPKKFASCILCCNKRAEEPPQAFWCEGTDSKEVHDTIPRWLASGVQNHSPRDCLELRRTPKLTSGRYFYCGLFERDREGVRCRIKTPGGWYFTLLSKLWYRLEHSTQSDEFDGNQTIWTIFSLAYDQSWTWRICKVGNHHSWPFMKMYIWSFEETIWGICSSGRRMVLACRSSTKALCFCEEQLAVLMGGHCTDSCHSYNGPPTIIKDRYRSLLRAHQSASDTTCKVKLCMFPQKHTSWKVSQKTIKGHRKGVTRWSVLA